jgi:rare lipoprotein A
MNNKFLLTVALLGIVSGCATQTAPLELTTEGGGSGSVGSGYDSADKTAFADTDAPVIDRNLATKSKSYNSSSQNNNFYLKNNELNTFKSVPKPDLLNTPSVNRYSNNSHKNIRSGGAPASSAGNPSNYNISGKNYKILPFSNGFVERGVASWYGADFHGEKTSNGEKYDMYAMTAAHKRLPIPSYVRVTNLKNKRNVVLRINDRGPFYEDRVIDLSYAAAQKLDIHQPGTEMVQIEAIKTKDKEKVYLQLGVFSNPANAKMLQKKVAENDMPMPIVKEVQVNGKLAYRVQLGPVFSTAKVNEFNVKLAKMGISETWYITENKVN